MISKINSPYLEIKDLKKDYKHQIVLKHVNLSIFKGEFFSIIGPSGCGKTTLLRSLAGFESINSGKIILEKQDITKLPPYKRPINMMFQSYALFPHMTVGENIAFALKNIINLSRTQIENKITYILKLVGMNKYINRKPDSLSGGQKQRVALARTLVRNPKLVLLDEPLAALDEQLRNKTQFELVNIQESIGATFLMVTHNQEEVMTMSTRIAVMEDGCIRQVGTPQEIYEFPNSKYVATFVGQMNVFDATVIRFEKRDCYLECYEQKIKFLAEKTNLTILKSIVTIALRPEKINISKEKPQQDINYIEGKVDEIAYSGDISIYHVRLKSHKIVRVMLKNSVRFAQMPIKWEEKVYLSWDKNNLLILTS